MLELKIPLCFFAKIFSRHYLPKIDTYHGIPSQLLSLHSTMLTVCCMYIVQVANYPNVSQLYGDMINV